jgi:hypothetical protein
MGGQFARPLLGVCELVHIWPFAFSSMAVGPIGLRAENHSRCYFSETITTRRRRSTGGAISPMTRSI